MKREIRYNLMTADAEVKNRQDIVMGCASDHPDPTLIKSFSTEAEALAALSEYKSTARRYDGFYRPYWLVTEYWVEEVEYVIDEDGDATPDGSNGSWFADFDENYQREDED